ncbi:MAG: hypothetical protein L3K10_02795 [Thermoplasmata archaeon]|nr:hypothetical protein [Thermoplasmata archaeon]
MTIHGPLADFLQRCWGRHGGMALGVVVVLVAATLLPWAGATNGVVGGAHPGTPAAIPAVSPTPTTPPAIAAVAPPPTTVHAAPSSGRGIFFLNSPLPTAPAASWSCAYQPYPYTGCLNNTGAPSIVSTPSGVIATAYTTFTNATACPGYANWTNTEIGISVSTNGGAGWNVPTYIGNPDCSSAHNYTSAISPAITALGNGTLVLAYTEYNDTNGTNGPCIWYLWFPALLPCYVQYDRLVVTESYDNGTTWTAPSVINASSNTLLNVTSWMPAQPSIAATGDTVYLAWTNFTYPVFDGSTRPPSIGLNLVVSTNGAQTWGAPILLPVEHGAYFGSTTYTAYAPSVLVGLSGVLYVTYATNLQENTTLLCLPAGCAGLLPPDTMDVVVASSSTNGSSFSLSTVARNVPVLSNGYTWISSASLLSPEPTIAQDPTSGELYVAWSGATVGESCPFVTFCFVQANFENVWVGHSTNGGSTWSSPVPLGTSILQPNGGATGQEDLYTPSLGVGTNGTLYVDVAYTNESVCLGPGNCDQQTELVFVSTDRGLTFPTVYSPDGMGSIYPYPLWDGIQTSMTILQGVPFMAWTHEVCPMNGLGGGCTSTFGFGFAYSQVVVTSLFEGTGVTVTFNESGLPAGAPWNANLDGNLRSGLSGSALTVSGVPTGLSMAWSVPWVNVSYGHAYGSTVVPVSPGAFAANTTVHTTFDPYVRLNLLTVPPAQHNYPFWCGGTFVFGPEYCGNMEVYPTPGPNWVRLHSLIDYNVTDTGLPQFCGPNCFNLTFLSWTGVGSGSWNTTNPNGTSTLNGPVNETASFSLLNVCSYGSCQNVTYSYNFTEVGLPAGTNWTVTLGNQTLAATTTSLTFSAGTGPYFFTVWTIPYNATESWYGVPSYPSPITSLQGSIETIRFALTPLTAIPSEVTFDASGLPAGVTNWGLNVDATHYGVPLANTTLDLGGGSHVLNASAVYGSNGVGAYLTGFRVVPDAVGASAFTVLPGATVNFSGPALVTALFSPEYWVTVTASSGGTVSPASVGWTPSGADVLLDATHATGFAFVGWTGTGPGSVSSNANSITANPTGPITELATFSAVVPTFQVEVVASGIQPSVPVTVTVGAQTFTAPAPFNVTGLLANHYPIRVPTVYPSGTVGVRYDASSISSSLGFSGSSLDVTANGTLTLGYTTSFALTLAPTANGTTAPGSGTYWEVAGSPVGLTATPLPDHSFADWIGLGTGSVSGPSASISVTPTGPVTETAYFTTNATVPPATYTLTLTETGLPSGTTWSASIGSNGVSGTGSLVLAGLNGTLVVHVPIVPGATGVRYVPSSNGTFSDSATQNRGLQVVFTTQYEVNVLASAGGTVTPGSEWADSGAVLALSATANSTSEFVNWSGTGIGSYSGTSASTSLTVTGPVTEFATFAPHASTAKSGTSGGIGPWLLPIALLVVLLVVGLIVGLVLGRSSGGRPPAAAAEEETEPTTDTSSVPQWNEESEPISTPPPSGGGDDESVYGGGSG